MVNKQLKVGLFNAGSLGTGHDNFIDAITRNDIDILAVNETWLKPGEEGRAPTLTGYRLHHIPRPLTVRSRGGGVGFYIKRSINTRILPHPVDPLHISVEQMWLAVVLNGRKIVIGTAYRPPWMNVDIFLDAISDSISSFSSYDNLILMGDFNINLFQVNDMKTLKLMTFLSCLGLSQLITEPTHHTETSQSLIDIVCSNLSTKNTLVQQVGNVIGHCLVICEFHIKREKPVPRTISYRPLKNINMDAFNADLQLVRWDLMSTLDNVNEIVHAFNCGIVYLFDYHAPLKTVTIRDHSYPWITDTIKIMMRLRDEASADYNKCKSNSKKEYYKSLKSLVNKALFQEKAAYYKHNINNQIKNPRSLWKNLKSTLLPRNDLELPPSFTDPNEINKHFLNIPGALNVSISQLTYFEHHRFGNATFHLEEVSLDSIIKIINKLKSNAEGCDYISLKMLIMTFPNTTDVIKDLINMSINSSVFPDVWKTAIVRPLPKVSHPAEMKDLRPISNLPCLSKIMEKVVCGQLVEYLESNNILPETQSGFRKGRGTVTAMLDVTDNILCAQDEGLCTILVLLDFSRAFDSINLNLLLSKLSYYGFDVKALKWFHSYLSERYQYVELNRPDGSSIISERIAVTTGVPQGSILGPILFILYTADIGQHIHHCKFHIYADDIQLYISFKPSEIDNAISILNEDLLSIATWSTSNCLLLNPEKTKYLLFGSSHRLATLCPSINVMLQGQAIARVMESRNLGLHMDAGLRFEKHVIQSVKTCFYKHKVLYKARPFLQESLRVQLVESLILSKLNYMDTVFGPRLLARTQKLIQRVQNACARFCFSIPFRAHVTPYLNEHTILKMRHRRKLHLACLLFGVLKFKAPSYLYNKLSWLSKSRPHGSRRCADQLATKSHRSATFRGSFRYAATKCWNNIPPPIRNIQNAQCFKINLKKFIFKHQKWEELLTHDTSAI